MTKLVPFFEYLCFQFFSFGFEIINNSALFEGFYPKLTKVSLILAAMRWKLRVVTRNKKKTVFLEVIYENVIGEIHRKNSE